MPTSTGFVYCWTDSKTNMLYVGVHKGSPDDSYVCSSKKMNEEYAKRPSDFSRQIIAEGIYEDMRKLETKILDSVNAKEDSKFYNLHNGNGNFYLKFHTDEAKKKISKGNKNNKRPDLVERNKLGLTLETRKKISINHADCKGEKNPNFGKRWSDEKKASFSERRKKENNPRFNVPVSEETKKKMSEARKEFWKRKRGIVS